MKKIVFFFKIITLRNFPNVHEIFFSARAKSIQGTVTSGAEKVVGTAVQGTKTVAHGVVTHTKSAADTLQSGIENGAKVEISINLLIKIIKLQLHHSRILESQLKIPFISGGS